MKLEMSNNWFWILFWSIVVGGCVGERALNLNYQIEQQKLEIEKLKEKVKLEHLNMKNLSNTVIELKKENK